MNESMNERMNQSMNQSANQSVSQSMSQSVSQSVSQSILVKQLIALSCIRSVFNACMSRMRVACVKASTRAYSLDFKVIRELLGA